MQKLLVIAGMLCIVVPVPVHGSAFQRPLHRVRHEQARALRGSSPAVVGAQDESTADPAQVSIGEQLFLEPRFAQYFAAHFDGNVNHPLTHGDPTVSQVQTGNGTYPSPFAGQSMNCRSCHFVDEFNGAPGMGNRTYADFTARTPIPDRGDGHTTTPRNALNMVDSSIRRPAGLFLHGDGEFSKTTTLVESTLTGRNYGWLPSEYQQAVAHIARVIREDDGTNSLAQQYAGAYSKALLGTAPDIPDDLRLPAEFRIDVNTATDEEIVNEVSRLVSTYIESLEFARDDEGVHAGSPYDAFLAKNDLPAVPVAGVETQEQYSERLLRALELLKGRDIQYVTAADGQFQTHNQQFAFGPLELEGLKIFLAKSIESASAEPRINPALWVAAGFPCAAFVLIGWGGFRLRRHAVLAVGVAGFLCTLLVACGGGSSGSGPAAHVAAHTGNCVTCHTAPNFSDFKFHNTGASQEEYDAVRGAGTFDALNIPDFNTRKQAPDDYLPANPLRPDGSGIFRAPASAGDVRLTDLGMWNIYANDDYPEPQAQLRALMCGNSSPCDPQQVLDRTIGRFKTPVLRDLGHSQPYLHSGRMATIEDVVTFYRQMSELARAGKLRNADPAIAGISMDDHDAKALAAFLRALNEDYD